MSSGQEGDALKTTREIPAASVQERMLANTARAVGMVEAACGCLSADKAAKIISEKVPSVADRFGDLRAAIFRVHTQAGALHDDNLISDSCLDTFDYYHRRLLDLHQRAEKLAGIA